jgi:hypothetical protein
VLFAAPYYLIALLGITVPIAIHLWNRKKGRIIKVGSIKHLAESDAHKMSSIKISEWLLMFLRMGLIILLTLLMSGLYRLSDTSTENKVMVLVDRDYLSHPNMQELIDSISELHDIRLFENNFPSLAEPPLTEVSTDNWTLISQLGLLHSDSIVIYAPLQVNKFKGQFEQLPAAVSWVSLPQGVENPFIYSATWRADDSIALALGMNGSQYLSYEELVIPVDQRVVLGREVNINLADSTLWFSDALEEVVKITDKPSFKIGIYAGTGYGRDVKYVEAGFETLSHYVNADFDISAYQEEGEFDLVVWLADDEFERSDRETVLKLALATGHKELVTNTAYATYELTRRINPYFSPESILLAFPEVLLSIVNKELLGLSAEQLNDRRPMDVKQLYGNVPSIDILLKSSGQDEEQPMDQWVWVVFLSLFLIERSVSLMKKS